MLLHSAANLRFKHEHPVRAASTHHHGEKKDETVGPSPFGKHRLDVAGVFIEVVL